MLSDWILALEGTPAGHQAALILALTAAALHAVLAALQKGRYDPWLSRGAIDISYATLALPFALFAVPWPEPHLWPILGLSWLIHTVYKLLQAMAFSRGAFTVVYPVVRGTSPLVSVLGAYLLFNETFTATQWLGVAVLLSGIFGLAIYNLIFLESERDTLVGALGLAVLTGVFVALYTTFDAYGVRATQNPFTFLAWFFVIDGLIMPILAALRWRSLIERPPLAPLMLRGLAGGIVALVSFGSIILATRLDKVGEAAILRETSAVFAALIGWIFLRETVGPRRIALIALIALGAVIVELGG
jgi:drug/metabolite transporter (DMT)-like permease